MYKLAAESSFDSAHFLSGYVGKCGNIHGHRWRVLVEVKTDQLNIEGQLRGMYVDFKQLRADLESITDELDHALIIEKGTLKPKTMEALLEEEFAVIEVEFRPTAENFAEYFFSAMREKGYNVASAQVYETPNNVATYLEE